MALEMKYFVLRPRGSDAHAVASRAALIAYADNILAADGELAIQLRLWACYEGKRESVDVPRLYQAKE